MTTPKQSGAAAALAALRLNQPLLEGNADATVAENDAAFDAALAALLAAAGPMPEQAEGAYRALAEILCFNAQGIGDADLDHWQPEVLLTPEEVAARRAEFRALEAAGWPLPPRTNVLPFHRPS